MIQVRGKIIHIHSIVNNVASFNTFLMRKGQFGDNPEYCELYDECKMGCVRDAMTIDITSIGLKYICE